MGPGAARCCDVQGEEVQRRLRRRCPRARRRHGQVCDHLDLELEDTLQSPSHGGASDSEVAVRHTGSRAAIT
jgi:hypothetical protein